MNRRLLSAVIAGALLCAFANQRANAALMIDFNSGTSPTETGFTPFSLTNATNFAGSFIDVAGTDIDNGSAIRVTIDGNATAAGAQRLVDRGDAGWAGGQNALLREWVGVDNRPNVAGNGNQTTVRLDNLKAGVYTIRSYHTDIGTGGNQDGVFDFTVDGATRQANFQILGQATSPVSTATPNFFEAKIIADGVNPVELSYIMQTNAGDTGFPVLNGFEVNPIEFRSLNIINGSFEDPNVGVGGFSDTDPTGWVGNNDFGNASGRFGVIDEQRSEVNDTTDGTQLAHLQGGGAQMGQLLGTVNGLLDVDILVDYVVTRRSNEDTATDHLVHLIAGDALTYAGGDILDTVAFNTALANNDQFLSVSLNLLATGATANSHLWLVFENNLQGGITQLAFDSVSAMAAIQVPEPTTGLLALMGIGGLAARRRRNAA